LRIVLTQQGNCVSPITANDAATKGHLSPATLQGINGGLKNVPTDIIKVPLFSK
jgi:hypothetical protein